MIDAIRIYIIASWLYRHHVPLLPKLLQLLIFLVYNSSISPKTKIGKGTKLSHGGIGILINPNSTIGKNCSIGTNVSIVGQGPFKYCPKIGNRVYIGSGAVIQGPVIIEDNVIIAPNSVVNKSIRKGLIVGGIPAKVIGKVENLKYDIFANESWDERTKPYINE